MMKCPFKHMSYLLISCLLLTGCWSSSELSDITIATALAIDKAEGGIEVTLQVLNPGEIAGGEDRTTRTAVSIYSATGKTFFEAVRKLTKVTPRKVFLSHLRLIVYGDELAKDGIAKTLDFLIRDHEFRTDFVMAIAKDIPAKDLISVLTPLEKIPADKVFESISASQDYWAPTKEVYLDELVNMITSDGREAVLTGIYVLGNPQQGSKLQNVEETLPETNIVIDDIGVFKADKLIGWLNEEESKGFNYLIDNVKNTIEWLPMEENKSISFEVTESNSTVRMETTQENTKVHVTVKTTANIADVESDYMIKDQASLKKLEKQLEDKIKASVEKSIQTAQGMKADIFGFGEEIKRHQPKRWLELKDKWPEQFTKINTNIDIQATIRNSGMLTIPFFEKIEKKQEQE